MKEISVSEEQFKEEPNTTPQEYVLLTPERVIAQRGIILKTIDEMPVYLVKKEVNSLIRREENADYRLIMDVMWNTGARISEALALTRNSIVDNPDEKIFGVYLTTLKKRGRPKKRLRKTTSKRYIPIWDENFKQRLRNYLSIYKPGANERLFQMTRQSVNNHIKKAASKGRGTALNVSSHTFRHSYAIHLLLHGRPLKFISKMLGHSSIQSTEIYTNVFTVDLDRFMEGVYFS